MSVPVSCLRPAPWWALWRAPSRWRCVHTSSGRRGRPGAPRRTGGTTGGGAASPRPGPALSTGSPSPCKNTARKCNIKPNSVDLVHPVRTQEQTVTSSLA